MAEKEKEDPYKGTNLEGKSADYIFADRIWSIALHACSTKEALFYLSAAQEERALNEKREAENGRNSEDK